jgi:hypothetical protein
VTRSWLLPPGAAIPALGAGDVPEVTAATAREVVARLVLARPVLLELGTERILRAVEAAVDEWMGPSCPERREAESAFAAATGMPLATAPFTVPLEPCAHGAVREWVRAEVSALEALDGFVPAPGGGSERALGPGFAVFVLPGNVPGVWLPALIAALAGRTPCLLKPAAADPLTPAAFAGTLIRHLPELAPALAVLPWRGGDAEVEREVLREAEALLWWGGAEVGSSLAGMVSPSCEVVAHGPALAAGAVARESMTPGKLAAVAAGAARDALLFDGRGCLSLSAVFLEQGGLYQPREAAGDFAKAVAAGSAALPPGRPSADAAALTQSWRARARARTLAGRGTVLFASGAGLDWTVIYEPEIALPPVPLWRTLWLHPVDRLDDVPAKAAAPAGGAALHALAFAGPEKRGLALAGALAAGGLTRMCPFGRLQSPPLNWSGAGGISPFARLLRRVRMEK